MHSIALSMQLKLLKLDTITFISTNNNKRYYAVFECKLGFNYSSIHYQNSSRNIMYGRC